jgi:hypothetical protein
VNSKFGSKLCQRSRKTAKNEGISVDVIENKGTQSVTTGISVDVAENKAG